ncbi:MAG: hypothetical protein DMF04_04655 [Verrucomicrobia bacterium]|nr:MAG: hypothetical protein DMF04_04655 [Verrucomicrobiota bacterium]
MPSHPSLFASHGAKVRALLLFLTIAFLPTARIAATAEEEEASPYFGDWENGHGDTLLITSGSIQINDAKPLRYDDITEDSDGSFFVLELKDWSESSYFEGKFLRLTFGKDPDRFTMSIYKTLPNALKKENEVKRAEWRAQTDDDEETDDADDTE